eukprot:GSMAST32.ASY1.ANO1.2504.1 assembled CDS
MIVSVGVLHLTSTLPKLPNKCQMTYSWPNYSEIPMLGESRLDFKYKLYRFFQPRTIQGTVEKPLGVPALFVHGNLGTYKQVRSLASTADAECSIDNYLDYYAVDFGEEMSAVVGYNIWDQSEFVNDCIRVILSKYSKKIPGDVAILAHSMGGIVARGTFLLNNYTPGTIRTIVTLSAPHARPPFYNDRVMGKFYDRVNSVWKTVALEENKRNASTTVVTISVSGGHRDYLVPAEFSSINTLIPSGNGFSILTSRTFSL